MTASDVTLVFEKKGKKRFVPARRVDFSPFQCFRFDGSAEEQKCLRALASHLMVQPGLAIYGVGELFDALLKIEPELLEHVETIITDEPDVSELHGLPATLATDLHSSVETVFLGDMETFPRMQKRQRLPSRVRVIGPEVVPELTPDIIPARAWRAWMPIVNNIYPLNVPEIRFEKNLDMILLDCPARNLALMPNGLGYVHNALKKTSIAFQTFDLDIVTYHRFQIERLFDAGGKIVLPDGRELPDDPWEAEHYDLWGDDQIIAYFDPILDEVVDALVAAKPKILGLSIHACNETFSRKLARRVKGALPDIIIIVGGFSCYNADIGRREFLIADYMCIGEADLTVGPLVEALARGERPRNQPGILSRYDSPDHAFVPAPMPHNLDLIDFPRYDWFDLDLYRNFNDYQLTPIIASRGCRWSRCTFCAERFFWRIRSAKNFVDELEWLIGQGCVLFMFNESDLNGMPEKLLGICDEIIRRGIKVKLTGQLRIHNKSDKAFYEKLAEAGFVALRFGIDAFSRNTLKLQKKGYTVETICQNLRDCWNAGIFTEVNWVIGVPGETEADVDEGIELFLANQQYIGRLANVNPLILTNGGVYWLEPEKHNIRFRRPKEELYALYPRALPAKEWYSVEPYIDAQVRKKWFEKIVLTLHESGFQVGPWATRVIEDVKSARDRWRTGGNSTDAEEDAGEKWPEIAPQATGRADTAVELEEKLIAELDTHRIVYYKNIYYGVPRALGDLRVSEVDLSDLIGILEDDTEGGLRIQIEEASYWANSRGHYRSRERQRASGSYMRVDSAATEADAVIEIPEDTRIIQYRGKRYAVDRSKLSGVMNDGVLPEAIGDVAGDGTLGSKPHTNLDTSVAAPKGYSFVNAVTVGATPEPICTVGTYNLVRFDGTYYCVPFGHEVCWAEGDIAKVPGVVVADNMKEAMRALKSVANSEPSAAGGAELPVDDDKASSGSMFQTPWLLASKEDYNIVSYEGWIYGIPQRLGPIDLTEVDVMEMHGVIRDVSRDTVELEIAEMTGRRNDGAQTAEAG